MNTGDFDYLIATIGALSDALQRPVKWQCSSVETDDEPTDDAPDGFEPAGAWEPIGAGPYQTRQNGGPEDMTTLTVWRRPLAAKP